jgi:hypothetical protein
VVTRRPDCPRVRDQAQLDEIRVARTFLSAIVIPSGAFRFACESECAVERNRSGRCASSAPGPEHWGFSARLKPCPAKQDESPIHVSPDAAAVESGPTAVFL